MPSTPTPARLDNFTLRIRPIDGWGTRWVTALAPSGASISVELDPNLEVYTGFPFWFARWISATFIALTQYPRIGTDATRPPLLLETILHEAAHAADQAHLGLAVWNARYLWRWAWDGFSYAGICDERTCKALAERQVAWWQANGSPAVFTLAMQALARGSNA